MVAVHPRGMVTVHRTLRGKTNHVLYKGTQNPPDLTLTVLEERTVYALSNLDTVTGYATTKKTTHPCTSYWDTVTIM